jgi:hypothetical protein
MTRKLILSKLSASAFAVAAVAAFTVNQAALAQSHEVSAGADGVELQVVPVDTGSDCNSIILKGTRRFQGTGFIMPRVLVGVTKENEDLFQITRKADGNYLLSIGLYFPESDQALSLRAGRSNLFLRGCNVESALHQINKDVDPKSRVDRLARLPVRSIEVVVDGISTPAYLGRDTKGEDSTLFNYEGQDHTAEFTLTPDQKDELLQRLERKQGISIRVNMKFAARSNDGALFAEVDLENLALNLQTALKGKYTITSGELKQSISNVIGKTKIRIDTEASSGKNEIFDKITENLINFVVLHGMDPNPAPRSSNASNLGQVIVAPTSTTTSAPAPISPAPQSSSTQTGAQPPTPDSSSAVDALLPASFKVEAVLDFLRSEKKRSVTYSNSSVLQNFVYTTPLNVQVRLQDPDVHELYVRPGERPATVPRQIRAGDQISIAVSKVVKETINYREKSKYLTANELMDLGVASLFPEVLKDNFIIHNEDTKQGFMAVGKLEHWFMYLTPYYSPERYFWVRKQTVAAQALRKEIDVSPTLQALQNLALSVTLSKVGIRSYQLSALVQDNAYWSASFDEVGGKIVLTAKRDLGYMTIAGVNSPLQVKATDIVVDQIMQETRQVGKPVVISEPVRIRKSSVPIERLGYYVYVGRPTDGQALQVLTPVAQQAPASVLPAASAAPQR